METSNISSVIPVAIKNLWVNEVFLPNFCDRKHERTDGKTKRNARIPK